MNIFGILALVLWSVVGFIGFLGFIENLQTPSPLRVWHRVWVAFVGGPLVWLCVGAILVWVLGMKIYNWGERLAPR